MHIPSARGARSYVSDKVDIPHRLRRMRSSIFPAIQGGIAAGLAFYVARHLIGHAQPFFAPMAAVIILSMSGGGKVKRAVQMVIGSSLGVGLGDLIISNIGSGAWQIALAVMIALTLASFVDTAPLVMNQTAIGAVLIATIMPPGTSGGTDRMVDALIGGVIGIIVVAFLPQSSIHGEREIGKVLAIASGVLHDVSRALHTKDAELVGLALNRARGSQAGINNMITRAKAVEEQTKVSPLKWKNRRRMVSLLLLLGPVDNTMRTTRVLARRAQVLVEDQDEVAPEQVELIAKLADITQRLAEVYLEESDDAADTIGELTHELRELGPKTPESLAKGRVFSAYSILAQTRSLIVDLLMVCGHNQHSARAVLAPTSDTPAVPPEN